MSKSKLSARADRGGPRGPGRRPRVGHPDRVQVHHADGEDHPEARALHAGAGPAVRELIGASQEVFAQLLAVSPMTVRSWEQGLRQPSPIARRFLDEIAMSPDHFRGRILTAAGVATRPAGPAKPARSI